MHYEGKLSKYEQPYKIAKNFLRKELMSKLSNKLKFKTQNKLIK